MVLFLDDDPARACLAYQRMTEADRSNTIWAKTAEEAITTIWDYRNKLKKIMLDHDLNGESYVNTKREDCGMEVVRFLEKKVKEAPDEFNTLREAMWIIHSWNTRAAYLMVKRLGDLGFKTKYVPFGMQNLSEL